MKRILAYLLLVCFTAVFTYETTEYLLFGKKEHSGAFAGIQELEEDTEGNEESREEKDDEVKFNDDYFFYTEFKTSLHISAYFIFTLNSHYDSSDYSAQIYSPPELV